MDLGRDDTSGGMNTVSSLTSLTPLTSMGQWGESQGSREGAPEIGFADRGF